MNILHLSTADLRHGAGIAAFRLHTALKKAGHRSHMLVAEKTSKDPDVISLENENQLIRGLQNLVELGINTCGPQNTFSFFSRILDEHPFLKEADIIHCHNLHWPFKNFSLNSLNIGRIKPLIWTFHDMWPITGHCYHAFECTKWKTGCGNCNDLTTFIPLTWDSTAMQWGIKKKIYAQTKFNVITPSIWLENLAKESPMMHGHPIHHIPNMMDTNIFRPLDRSALRKQYGFQDSDKLVLFTAGNINIPLKGLNYLLEALISRNISCTLLLAGNGKIPAKYKDKIHVHHFQKVHGDPKMAEIYNLSDVTIVPSTAENLSNVVLESLSCATPVVGSRVGGIPDMIDHTINGYLFESGNIEQLADGIQYFISDDKMRAQAGEKARQKVEQQFSENTVVTAHAQLYERMLMEKIKT